MRPSRCVAGAGIGHALRVVRRTHRSGRIALVAALALTVAACDWTGYGFDAAHVCNP